MKNVLVITPGVLPVPAYKGGAVEALIQSYILENEKKKYANLYVYTIKDEHNYHFQNTNLIDVDVNSILYKISKVIRYIINNKLPKIHIGNAYINKVCKKLEKDKTKYDVIIVENNPFAILNLRKQFPHTKIVLHLHNDYLNSSTKHAKKILDLYDEVIAISNFMKKRIETIYETDKVKVVHNGLDTYSFSKKITDDAKQTYREKYNLKDDDIVLLYTGRLVAEKGIRELILATIKLIDINPNIKLLIVGSKASSDSKKDKFIYEIGKLTEKYSKNIIFTGFITYDKLPIFHHISDIQVIPSRWGEPLGNVVIEGVSSGIKQVVTNDGGITEVIGDNTEVVEVDNLEKNIYDTILKITREKKYNRMVDNKRVELYSEASYTQKIFDIINDGDSYEK